MIEYIFLIVAIYILMKTDKFREEKKYIIAFSILFLFAALRGNGNGDYFTYLKYSDAIKTINDVLSPFPMEIGFRIIAYIKNLLGLHSQFVIIVMNLISVGLIVKFVRERSIHYMQSLFFYIPFFLQYDMHSLRSAVAISITTLSYQYIVDKKLMKFVGIILLATCFHYSALIMLPFYFILNINFTIKQYCAIFITVTLIPAKLYLNLTEEIFRKINLTRFANKISNYSTTKHGEEFSLLDPRILMLISILFLVYILIKKINFQTEDSQLKDKAGFSLKMLFWGVILMVVLRDSTIMVMRISAFFRVHYIIMVPIILNILKDGVKIWRVKIKHMYIEYGAYLFLIAYTGLLLYKYFYLRGVDYRVFF